LPNFSLRCLSSFVAKLWQTLVRCFVVYRFCQNKNYIIHIFCISILFLLLFFFFNADCLNRSFEDMQKFADKHAFRAAKKWLLTNGFHVRQMTFAPNFEFISVKCKSIALCSVLCSDSKSARFVFFRFFFIVLSFATKKIVSTFVVDLTTFAFGVQRPSSRWSAHLALSCLNSSTSSAAMLLCVAQRLTSQCQRVSSSLSMLSVRSHHSTTNNSNENNNNNDNNIFL
jgi:hypothetical protein